MSEPNDEVDTTTNADLVEDSDGEMVIRVRRRVRVREVAAADEGEVEATRGEGEHGEVEQLGSQATANEEENTEADVLSMIHNEHSDGDAAGIDHLTEEEAQAIIDLADVHRSQECCICGGLHPLSSVLPTQCGQHWVCYDCVPLVFQAAIDRESNYPPRCCQNISSLYMVDFEHIIKDEKLIQTYKAKTEEYKTNMMFRRYCADEKCGKFLPVPSYEDIDEGRTTIAECANCAKTNCIGCANIIGRDSRSAHKCTLQAPELKTDYNRTEVKCLETGRTMRMRACPKCGEAIELYDACNHMECRCGYAFCFICLLPLAGQYNCQGMCPPYGDPPVDDKGYYIGSGLHRDTGLNREGFNARGINVRGLNTSGQRVEGFAYTSESRFADGAANRPQGLLDMDDDAFHEAAMMEILHEIDMGIIPPSDDLEGLIEQRFGHIHRRDFRDGPWDPPIGNFMNHGGWDDNVEDDFEDDESLGDEDSMQDPEDLLDGLEDDPNLDGDVEDETGQAADGETDAPAQAAQEPGWPVRARDGRRVYAQPGRGRGLGRGRGGLVGGGGGVRNYGEVAHVVEGNNNAPAARRHMHDISLERLREIFGPADFEAPEPPGANDGPANEAESTAGAAHAEADNNPVAVPSAFLSMLPPEPTARRGPAIQARTCAHDWAVEEGMFMCHVCGDQEDRGRVMLHCDACRSWACATCFDDFGVLAEIYWPRVGGSGELSVEVGAGHGVETVGEGQDDGYGVSSGW